MAYPPFMNSTGLIGKVLDKIIEAQTPTRFTQDFLSTKIGFGSGSAKPIIPLLKRIGFLSNDGSPTKLYTMFRTQSGRGAAMAEAIRNGYGDFYERNEYAHDLNREKLKDLVIQVTGLSRENSTVPAIVGTFWALKEYADFEAKTAVVEREDARQREESPPFEEMNFRDRSRDQGQIPPREEGFAMNLGYTINLNLPESTNPDVFNAIFKALKENLLKR